MISSIQSLTSLPFNSHGTALASKELQMPIPQDSQAPWNTHAQPLFMQNL